MIGTLPLVLHGETLLLHAERALSWPARRLLVVADTHFGKGAVFAAHGIAVPAGPDALDRQRIAQLLQRTGAERLLILGDFLHGPLPPSSQAAQELGQWLDDLGPVRVELVTGNHDRTAASGWQPALARQEEFRDEAPFRFVHDPDRPGRVLTGGGFPIGGHIHPVVALGGLRKQRLRVPVFWLREESLVLPSFGTFTGGWRIDANAGGRVFAAAGDQVTELRFSRN